jgi:Transposase DNA-binding/Transposase Tn5 dimerisation domain
MIETPGRCYGWNHGTRHAEVFMVSFTLPPRQWAEEQFAACELGDFRRTRRAVEVAATFAANPSGSTPHQTENWADLKATYRLFDSDGVTFESLASPHWQQTRSRTSGHWLLLGDTTELDFGIHRAVKGLGPTGNGGGYGFHLHSALMVAADSEEIVGLAGQVLFYRQPVKEKENTYQVKQRQRESEVWGKLIDEIGPPTEHVRFTHVMDRGADNFEVYCHLLRQRSDSVVRASQMERKVRLPDGSEASLKDYLRQLPAQGAYEVAVPARPGQSARTAEVEVRYGQVAMPAPRHLSPWLRKQGIKLITMWVVEVREVNPAKGATPLHWALYTSHAVTNSEQAQVVIGYYKKRWLIEEFHKALKTGCSLEERQYQTSDRLEAVTGMQSVVAVRLLQLKSVARTDPERSAAEVVPTKWITILRLLRPKADQRDPWTVRDFYRQLAGLGGFLGRKCDGEPGWITLWRGFDKLVLAIRYEERRSCG